MKRSVYMKDLKKDLNEFVNRCQQVEVIKILEEQRPENAATKWGRANREKLRTIQKRYASSEEGKLARVRVNCTRHRRFREAVKHLTRQEIEDIKQFYMHRPKGYHVDHVVPLSKGGLHHLSNLQYLTAEENLRKNAWVSAEALCEYHQRKRAEKL